MKLVYFFFMVCILNSFSTAQVELSASMCINFIKSPSLYDYINQNYNQGEIIEGFNASVIFSGEAGYNLSKSYQPAIEIAYLINSYTTILSDGRQYEMAYGNLMFSILNYYVITGEGYNFKFGGGGGLRFLSADETISGITQTFSSTGYGFLLRAEGNTLLGGNIYAKIGAQASYDLNGEPENKGTHLTNANENVNFNSLSIGLSLGVSYIF